MSLNRGKCEILGDGDLEELSKDTGAKGITQREEWTYLGCPLAIANHTHPAFKEALAKCKLLEERIGLVDDPQAQLALWRKCMGCLLYTSRRG